MAYFPYSRFDFALDKQYYYPLSFDYDNNDKVNVVVADETGRSSSLTEGDDYTLEGDRINLLVTPRQLCRKYNLTITKVFAIRFSGICVTPEFTYGIYLDVKKIQNTLEAMALQLAEVQMTSENSVKLAYEEWENSNVDPTVQIPTIRERAGRIFAFDDDGKAIMIRDADLAETIQKYIKSAKNPVIVDASLLSYSFPGIGNNGFILPEEYAKLESVFSVKQGDITYKAVDALSTGYPVDKGTFFLRTALTNISGIEIDKDTIRGTELSEMTADSAMIAVTVLYRDLEGYADEFIRVISLSRTKTGPEGKDGEDGHSYTIRIESSNGVVFRMGEKVDTTLSIQVLRDTTDITEEMEDYRFKWSRKTSDEIEDEKWNTSEKALYHKSVYITTDDCLGRTVFECEVNLENLQ